MIPRTLRSRSAAWILLLTLGLSACSTGRGPSLVAAVDGPGTPSHTRGALTSFAQARAGDELNVLVLSGGGQNGAFSAGALKGWRDAGRPRFDVVTGISAGGLLATFAFLGTPADDARVEAISTDLEKSDVLCMRSPLALPFAASLADFAPMRRFLEREIDDATVARVAAASEGGRRLLLVGTTNLDTGRLAVWDLGALARAGNAPLYRAVLLASASPPVLAPPVLLGGVPHSDGSLIGNVFVPDAETHLDAASRERYLAVVRERKGTDRGFVTLHVLYAGLWKVQPTCTEMGVVPVATRAFDLLLSSSGHGSLWYAYGLAQRRGQTFRMLSIPERLHPIAKDPIAFDRASLRALFDAGVAAGRDPSAWRPTPPTLGE